MISDPWIFDSDLYLLPVKITERLSVRKQADKNLILEDVVCSLDINR